ncbi:MAG: D-tyrosyl-tRNA(Tyr) deacylase [Clostridiales bacterium]|nr:D-tyrosyl-tRNA(Tyr) deacylase [Clostridiales bacterium]
MRAVIQRTTGATVKIDGNIVGEIGTGFVILLGIGLEDSEEDAMLLADKCTGLRIFEDENEKMNLSLSQVNGQLLVQTGEFGADMKLSVLNDGPVTLIIDTKDFKKQ